MKYELWHSPSNGSYTFFPTGKTPPDQLEPDAILLWTTEADSWEEAQTRKHQFLGWEPYVPMAED